MIEYASKAGMAWFLGFFPLIEIYAAVPAAIALGLDYISAAFWSVIGNYTPVLLIVYGYDQLMRIERLRRWLEKLRSERFSHLINRYGAWFILLITPWTGVWVVAATAHVFGMKRSTLLLFSFISVAAYGTLIAVGVQQGIAFFSTES